MVMDTGLQLGLISVVIANYNGERHLEDCLSSIRQQTYPTTDIVVVDTGSTDNSAGNCKRHGVEFVFTGGNNGLAAAYNLAVSRSIGQFALVANNDIWLAPNCIKRLVDAMERHGDRCFASDRKQCNWDQSLVIHYRPVLRPVARLSEILNGACSIFSPSRLRRYLQASAVESNRTLLRRFRLRTESSVKTWPAPGAGRETEADAMRSASERR